MKWYFASNEAGLVHQREHVMVAVNSARVNTALEPHLIYDGGDHPMLAWLARRGVRIVRHRLPFDDGLRRRVSEHPYLLRFGTGAYLRTSIPLIDPGDGHVLYTDCDVMFLRDPGLDRFRPRFLAASVEHDRSDWSYFNTGVMVLNLRGMRETHDELVRAIVAADYGGGYNQGPYNDCYRDRWDRLPSELNWKPYWGRNEEARVVHFHGPKVAQIRALRDGTYDGSDAGLTRLLYERDRDGFAFYLDLFDRYRFGLASRRVRRLHAGARRLGRRLAHAGGGLGRLRLPSIRAAALRATAVGGGPEGHEFSVEVPPAGPPRGWALARFEREGVAAAGSPRLSAGVARYGTELPLLPLDDRGSRFLVRLPERAAWLRVFLDGLDAEPWPLTLTLRPIGTAGAAIALFVAALPPGGPDVRIVAGVRHLIELARQGRRWFRRQAARRVNQARGRGLEAPLRRYRELTGELGRVRAGVAAAAPLVSIVMPVHDTPAEWLAAALGSVHAQTYPRWELICVDDGSAAAHVVPQLARAAAEDQRIRVVRLDRNRGVAAATNAGLQAARGDYVGFLDHDDALEPQALLRLADAIGEAAPDLIYSDEILVGPDGLTPLDLAVRPAFSYDHYLSHPYFVHFVAVRRAVAEEVGGLDESLAVSQDVDFVLRVLERPRTIAHVPDLLYRWRVHGGSLGHRRQEQVTAATVDALRRHLRRLGVPASVEPGAAFNFHDVRFALDRAARVGVVIPTRNRPELLRGAVASVLDGGNSVAVALCVVDHGSDDPAARAYLGELARRHLVVRDDGEFNFPRLNNLGVARLGAGFTHYLFLNNDVRAIAPGWLDRMVARAGRADIGAVGATLLYADGAVQHVGVTLGLMGDAEHVHKWDRFADEDGRRRPGPGGAFLVARDYAAATAACLLVRADAFAAVGGFDERFVVGYNDVDLCLRLRAAGYRVVNEPAAVLTHLESATRGVAAGDFHPADTARFRARHGAAVAAGDPWYSPFLSRRSTLPVPEIPAPRERVAPRVVRHRPPGGQTK